MGEVQHILYTLLTLHLTCTQTRILPLTPEGVPPHGGASSPEPTPTCGVPGVDDAEGSGLAVLLGSLVSSLQLLHVQSPAVCFI